MRFQYPVDAVRLPNVDNIFTISEAWDYGAKVFLHMSRMLLKFPPDPALDAKLASSIYSFVRTVTSHTDKEIAEFESIHRRIIEEKMQLQGNNDTSNQHAAIDHRHRVKKEQPDYDQLSFDSEEEQIHTPLPSDTGKVTHSSLASLYGAIVCSVISHRNCNETSGFETPSEVERIICKAICTNFQILYVDERMRKHWISWFEVMADVEHDGIGAAIAKHVTKTEDGYSVKLTRKQVQKKLADVLEMAQQANTYLPLFDELFKSYGKHIKSDSARADNFALQFEGLQFSIYEQLATYRYAAVIHGNGKPCPVSPYESLRIVDHA
ncbi:MAG TPA: hypothetical protein VGE97_01315 [Nitrososphaera sp.]|jgi:hypothetical protein